MLRWKGIFNSIRTCNCQMQPSRFAGHSKWKNIMHIKALKDGQKSALFIKYARQIRLAIQDGGPNPALNSALRSIIDEAVRKNMPMASINNQIKKSAGNQVQLKKLTIEMKVLNKVFMIGVFYTENLQLVKSPVFTLLRRTGQNSAVADVKHMFDEMGIVQVMSPDGKLYTTPEFFEEKMTEIAIEVDAQEVEDIDFENKTATFVCRPIDIEKVKRLSQEHGFVIENADHVFMPKNTIQLSETEYTAYETLKHKMSQIEGFDNLFDNVEEPEND